MACTEETLAAMIAYYAKDPRRVNHFLKVYGFAKTIGKQENLDAQTQEILEVAAVVHDIGIKVSEEKYGDSLGRHQEEEGPGVAEALLKELGYDAELIERVSYLVGHHHTYRDIQGMDYQILVEADFLVNLFEDDAALETIPKVQERVFKTESGKKILQELYL